MSILVSDANIVIDFDVAGLLNTLFLLPDEFVTTNILFHDELMAQHSDLPSCGLQVVSLDGDAIKSLEALVSLYPKPSFQDLSALALAKRKAWTLLSGDKHLRQAAQKEEVLVHGTLWLSRRLVENGVLDVTGAKSAFDTMKDQGRRLPWAEVDRLIASLTIESV